MRRLNLKASQVQLPRENQRLQRDANAELLRRQKRLGAKAGIVGDREAFGHQAAAEEREAQIAHLYVAAERGGELFFDGGAERVCVYEELDRHYRENDETDDCQQNFRPTFHGDSSARRL